MTPGQAFVASLSDSSSLLESMAASLGIAYELDDASAITETLGVLVACIVSAAEGISLGEALFVIGGQTIGGLDTKLWNVHVRTMNASAKAEIAASGAEVLTSDGSAFVVFRIKP